MCGLLSVHVHESWLKRWRALWGCGWTPGFLGKWRGWQSTSLHKESCRRTVPAFGGISKNLTWAHKKRGIFKHLSNQGVWSHTTAILVKQELRSVCLWTHPTPVLPSATQICTSPLVHPPLQLWNGKKLALRGCLWGKGESNYYRCLSAVSCSCARGNGCCSEWDSH